MDDEIWTTRDGTRIPVGEMSEDHVRNALRMILRQRRRAAAELIATEEKYDDFMPDFIPEWPDNHQVLADLRARHGDNNVRVERASVAGMGGGDVYVRGEKIGWFGGI